MANMLVIEDNFYFSKTLINIVVKEIPQIRLCKIATDGQDALDFIMNNPNNIDFILLDLKLPKCNGIEILNYMESNKLVKFKNSVIVISGEMELILQIRNNPYLFSYITKTSGIKKILEEIESLLKIKEDNKSSIEYKICNQLETLHYNFSYVGTKYLMETILLLYNTELWEDTKLEKDIYPIISKKYKKSVNNIKCNIIHATNEMFFDCEQKKLLSYLKEYSSLKPGPKKIIFSVLEKLKKPSI